MRATGCPRLGAHTLDRMESSRPLTSLPPPPPSPPQNRFRAVGADVAEARAETLKATLASFKDKLDAFAHAHR